MHSFRDLLLFGIGFTIQQNRDLMRRILKEHVADDARQMLAKRVVEHLELSGFEIDEERQVMRKKPPAHGTARGDRGNSFPSDAEALPARDALPNHTAGARKGVVVHHRRVRVGGCHIRLWPRVRPGRAVTGRSGTVLPKQQF
jgi:hypothetical protein